MTFDQIIGDLKNKIYRPVYFLYGEEPYYIDEISNFIENTVLTDIEKEFNQTIIYGRDTNVNAIISNAKRFPMMANYQVVIIKEAQYVDKIEELGSYIENPLGSTLLVINYKYKKIDKRKSIYKKITKKGILFESPKVYENKIPGWISNYVGKKGYSITPKASIMLTEFLGTNLSKIVNEIGKLVINIPENSQIDDVLIEKNIGISKDFNIFELQKALGTKNILKANQIAHYFAANPKDNPLVKTIVLLFGYFSKLLIYQQLKDKSNRNAASELGVNPFFVKDYQTAARYYSFQKLTRIISYLKEYDLKSKGVGSVSATDGELLKELLFKILH
ncbi:MAG: DNA polymerase III subunit delta [Bacteroidetes bacterium]|nr:MAG: DNA polymerase III subunit delta [Bacteroidota bacterium]